MPERRNRKPVETTASEACPHCGREDGQHDPACPLLSTRPTTGDGQPIEHDKVGEVVEDIPAFLKREPKPAPVVDEATARGDAAKKFPGMSKAWLDGYVARVRGAGATDCPDYAAQGLSPMNMRHWGAGWNARDIEEADGKEAQSPDH